MIKKYSFIFISLHKINAERLCVGLEYKYMQSTFKIWSLGFLGIVLISACSGGLEQVTGGGEPPLRLVKPASGTAVAGQVAITGKCVTGTDVAITIPGNTASDAGTVPCEADVFAKTIYLEGSDGVKEIRFAQIGGTVNITTSGSLIKDSQAPLLVISSPTSYEFVVGSSKTVSGTCEYGTSLEISYGNSVVGPTEADCYPEGTFGFNISLSGSAYSGTKSLTIKQKDKAGNEATAVRYFTFGASNSWIQMTTTNPPSARSGATTVWTGSKYIVWGGDDEDTAAYIFDPGQNIWTRSVTINAPSARSGHTAIWTGTKMIIWGGVISTPSLTYYNSGAAYDPSNDTWTTITTTSAPTARSRHVAVYTSGATTPEMFVWGGQDGSSSKSDGAAYNPTTNTWRSLAAVPGGFNARVDHSAIWTGTRVVVWGGRPDSCATSACFYNDGAAWTPAGATGSWATISSTSAPTARVYGAVVWTGTKMLVWGGSSDITNKTGVDTGAVWTDNGGTGSWSAISTTSDPSARFNFVGAWIPGSKLMVWGGSNGATLQTGAYLYDPDTNAWSTAATIDQPSSREAAAFAAGSAHVFVWGGFSGSNVDTGSLYVPSQ